MTLWGEKIGDGAATRCHVIQLGADAQLRRSRVHTAPQVEMALDKCPGKLTKPKGACDPRFWTDRL